MSTQAGPLSFVHVPKTGGSTLRWILDRQYRRFSYVIPPWFRESGPTPRELADRAGSLPDAIGAHRPYRSEWWPSGPALALVRDPVRRVLSHVAHVRAEPEVWLPDRPPELDLPLADWIERRPLALFDNDQVRYLSGAAEFDGMPLTATMAEADLERALETVRTRVCAAPMEAFDEALIAWRARFGWQPPYYRRVNVRRRPVPEISARDRSAVEAWNRWDTRLCQEVGAMFRERVAELERGRGWTLDQEVDRFRQRNASARVAAGLLWHTARRGVRHPLRAGSSLVRSARLGRRRS